MSTQTGTSGHTRTTIVYRPFYAAAGAGDLAVQQMRRSAGQVAEQALHLQRSLGHAQDRFTVEYDKLVVRGKAVVTQIRQKPPVETVERRLVETEQAAAKTAADAEETVATAKRGARRTNNTSATRA